MGALGQELGAPIGVGNVSRETGLGAGRLGPPEGANGREANRTDAEGLEEPGAPEGGEGGRDAVAERLGRALAHPGGAPDDALLGEFLALGWQEKNRALRLWKFWGAGDNDLAVLMERVRQQGVAGVTPDDLARCYVAMLRADGRRASAARTAMNALQGLADRSLEARAREAVRAAKAAQEEARDWRRRAEKAEAAERRWADRWENELRKARDEGREAARKQHEAELRAAAKLRGAVDRGVAGL